MGYNCRDLCMGHCGCRVMTTVSSSARRRVYHYEIAQFVAGCTFAPFATYLVYRPSAEMDWSGLRPSDCWFQCTSVGAPVYLLSTAEVMSQKCDASVELAPPQMLTACIDSWVTCESDWCVIADAGAHLGLPPTLDDATPSVPSASPGVVIDALGVELDTEATEICRTSHALVSSIFVSVCKGTSSLFKRSATRF